MAIQRKVVHVEFFEPFDGKRHYYFGSKAAVFQKFTNKQIGTTYGTMKTLIPPAGQPYTTKKCIIRIGWLIASKGLKEREKE